MDYEKAYKEVLDNAKKVLLDCTSDERNVVEYIFPELRETDDEKIRKEFCKDIWTFIPNEKAHKYIAWLEKQGKQKQEWSEEDERISKTIIIGIENEMFSDEMREEYQRIPNINKDYYQIRIDWLKGLKDRIQSKQSNKS